MTEKQEYKKFNIGILSGNALKMIAAFCMLVDHIGLIIFPNVGIFRIVGRLSFPIFAFMISEGCKYTKNKLKYFLSVFLLATACQTVFYIYSKDLYMCILVTFSVSIAVIYALKFMKKTVISAKSSKLIKLLSVLIFCASVAGAYAINLILDIDYGFFGCMAPVFASIVEREDELPRALRKFGTLPIRVFLFGVGLLAMVLFYRGISFFALLSLLVLLLYSGERGRLKMKYFFYVFYPSHLVILNAISTLM